MNNYTATVLQQGVHFPVLAYIQVYEYNQKREHSEASTSLWFHDAQMKVEVKKSVLGKKSDLRKESQQTK